MFEPELSHIQGVQLLKLLLKDSVQKQICSSRARHATGHSWQVGNGVALDFFFEIHLFACKGVQGDGEVIHSPASNPVASREMRSLLRSIRGVAQHVFSSRPKNRCS